MDHIWGNNNPLLHNLKKCEMHKGTTGELSTVVFNDVKSQRIPLRPCGSQHHTESDEM